MSEKKIKLEFFEFDNYPSGGYAGNQYIRVKDGNRYFTSKDGSLSHKSALTSQKTIEILWPDGMTSQHKILIETEKKSFRDTDGCQTFHSSYHHPFISIDHHGTSLGKVKLTSIKDIKIRIVSDDKSWFI